MTNTNDLIQIFTNAAKEGHLGQVKTLLAQNKNLLNAQNGEGLTAIDRAAWHGHLNIVEFLYNQGADIHTRAWSDEMTPLMRAASYGWFKVVRFLLDKQAAIEDISSCKRTALLYAIADVGFLEDHKRKDDYFETVKILIEANANVNVKDWLGNTPLRYAAKCRQDTLLDWLFAAGADPNKRGGHSETVLHHICNDSYNAARIIKLIEKGADLHAQNDHGETPLDLLIKSPYYCKERIEALKEIFPHIRHDTELLRKIFITAALNNKPDVLTIFKDNQIEFNDLKFAYEATLYLNGMSTADETLEPCNDCPIDANGDTLFMHLLRERNNDYAIKLIPFSNLYAVNKSGERVIDLLLKYGNKKVFKSALSFGMDIKQKTQSGKPLIVANVSEKKISLFLAQNGADLDYVSNNGTTLLMLAAEAKNEPLVDLILSRPYSRLNHKNKEGMTALGYAALHCDSKKDTLVAKRLLEARADPNLKYGKEPFSESFLDRYQNNYYFKEILAAYKQDVPCCGSQPTLFGANRPKLISHRLVLECLDKKHPRKKQRHNPQ